MKPRESVRRSFELAVSVGSLSIASILGAGSLAACGGTAITNFGDASSSAAHDSGAQTEHDSGGPPGDATLPSLDAAPPTEDGSLSDDAGADDAGADDAGADDAGPDDATVPIDDGTAPDAGPSDAGRSDAGANDASDDPIDAGDDDSGTCTVKIRKQTDAGLFCPRSKLDGGPAIDCNSASQVCCIPNQNALASTCQNGQTCGAKEMVWACAGPSDCAGKKSGGTCCLTVGGLEPDPQCSQFDRTTGNDSTACVQPAACDGTVDAAKAASSLYVVCAKKADCPSGTTCTPVRVLGTGIGLCL